ncbi:MAG: GNAT family protein [Pseudomonadota bacterium]
MEHAPVRLVPLADEHLEPLHAACKLDQDVWQIYPVNLGGDGFDETLKLWRSSRWLNSAVFYTRSDTLVGATSYIRPTQFGVVEVGVSCIAPEVRDGSFNRAIKELLIEHAFTCGFHKVELRADSRNKRSIAAIAKLGAGHEGTLRANMVTWTGYRRDTALYGLLKDDWNG